MALGLDVVAWGLAFVGLLGVVFWLLDWRTRRARAWRDAAAACGLTWAPSKRPNALGSVKGELDGVGVDVRDIHPDSETLKTNTTRLSTTLPQRLAASVRLCPRHLVTVHRDQSVPLVKTGDVDFDMAFELRSPTPKVALALLTPSVRARLLPLAERGGRWSWEGHHITWQVTALLKGKARVERMIAEQVDLTREVSAALMSARAFERDVEVSVNAPQEHAHRLVT